MPMMLGGVICNNQSNASFGATFIMVPKLRRAAINGGFALLKVHFPNKHSQRPICNIKTSNDKGLHQSWTKQGSEFVKLFIGQFW